MKVPLLLALSIVLYSLGFPTSAEAAAASSRGSDNPRDWRNFDPHKFRYQRNLVPDPNTIGAKCKLYQDSPAFMHDPTRSNVIYALGKKHLPTAIYAKSYDILMLGNKYFQAPAAGECKQIAVNGQSVSIYGTTAYTPLSDNSFVANPAQVQPFDPSRIFYKNNDLWPSVIYGEPGKQISIANQLVTVPAAGKSVTIVVGADGRIKRIGGEKYANGEQKDETSSASSPQNTSSTRANSTKQAASEKTTASKPDSTSTATTSSPAAPTNSSAAAAGSPPSPTPSASSPPSQVATTPSPPSDSSTPAVAQTPPPTETTSTPHVDSSTPAVAHTPPPPEATSSPIVASTPVVATPLPSASASPTINAAPSPPALPSAGSAPASTGELISTPIIPVIIRMAQELGNVNMIPVPPLDPTQPYANTYTDRLTQAACEEEAAAGEPIHIAGYTYGPNITKGGIALLISQIKKQLGGSLLGSPEFGLPPGFPEPIFQRQYFGGNGTSTNSSGSGLNATYDKKYVRTMTYANCVYTSADGSSPGSSLNFTAHCETTGYGVAFGTLSPMPGPNSPVCPPPLKVMVRYVVLGKATGNGLYQMVLYPLRIKSGDQEISWRQNPPPAYALTGVAISQIEDYSRFKGSFIDKGSGTDLGFIPTTTDGRNGAGATIPAEVLRSLSTMVPQFQSNVR